MSKISPATNPKAPVNLPQKSAWSKGPPTISSAAASSSSPSAASAAPAATANGYQASHSRRGSAVVSIPQQGTSTLKGAVNVSKAAAQPVPGSASKGLSNVQFGSIDDNSAPPSTSPAAPSTLTDPKQVRTFGSISATPKPATASASPTVTKSAVSLPGSSSTAASSAGQTVKRKIDIHKLFQQPSGGSSESAPPPAVPSTPTAPATPQDSIPPRPLALQPNTFEPANARNSPSVRNTPLPSQGGQPAGPPQNGPMYSAPHLRQPNGVGSPRSSNFTRGLSNNGSHRGPPGNQPGVLGSPRMVPPATPQQSMPTLPNMPMQNGMPNGPAVGAPHVPGQVPQPVPGQVPHGMGMQGMPPHMMQWPPGPYPYYHYYHYDPNIPNIPPHFWQGQPPPHMPPQPPAQPTPSQTPMQLHPVPPTPSQSQVPISPRPSPAISLNPTVPPTPSTPSMHTPTIAGSRLQSNAAPFQPQNKRTVSVSLRGPDGALMDIKALAAAKKDEEASKAKKEDGPTLEQPRKSAPVRMETAEAHKKRLDEEKKKEELSKVKAKRDAEAAERKRRDDEEKERRKREEDERERKKDDEDRRKREEEEERKRANQRRLEEERLEKERLEKERLEKERLEKERLEQERLEKERLEKERLEKERLEKERLAKEEADRKERERQEAEEKERQRKATEEAERIRLQEAEEVKRKAEKEAERKAEEEAAAAAKAKEEDEAAAAAAAAAKEAPTPGATTGTPADVTPAGSSPAPSTPAHSTSPVSGPAPLPRTISVETKPKRPIPGRLDLSGTSNPNLPQPLPSALASARIIEDIDKVSYPQGIKAPKSELNVNAASGKFRYDRDFLLQFMSVCKDKPDDLPPLDAIGLEPTDQSSFGGRPSRRPPGGPAAATVSRNMIGMGIVGPGGGPFTGKSFGAGGMGDFRGPRPSSEDRFAQATRNLGGRGVPFPAQPMPRNPNQNGPQMQNAPAGLGRPTSGRGRKRDSLRPGATPSQLSVPPVNAELIGPLQTTENRWTSSRGRHTVDENSAEYVDRKVKSLLNKLTLEKFESISKQILEWANRSVNETDGHTLIQVIRLVFEKATDEATWSEMYARLCRFLMERISPDVRDDSIRNNQDGKPIAGGNLFRKYLLNRCQEDFERGWSVKEAANAAAACKAEEDKAAADAAEKAGSGEEVLYSEEYYAAQKAKRRGLGLVKFIGELFKLQMLTERIMHECIKKLLSNVENPEEEEIESLCKLLATVGQTLDTAKAKNHMDIYFSRMKELAIGGKINSRIQFMILDVIELRTRSWVTRNQVAAPTTIAEVHEKAARDRAVQEREALLRQTSMREPAGRGRRDTGRNDYGPPQVGADGWTTPVTRPPQTKAGDLSKFGKIERSAGLQFGPASVFSKRGDKRESASVTRVSSSSNMFAMLNSSEATPDAVSVGSRTAASTRPPSRKASIDMSSGTASPIDGPQRRRLILQPRSIPFGGEGSVREGPPSTAATSDYGEEETTSNIGAAAPSMTLERAKQKINEDVKEFFMLKDLNEGEGYFESLPPDFRNELIETLFHKAIDAKESETQLVIELFGCAASKGLATESQFEKGFECDMEFLEDISVDVPQVYTTVAKLMRAAKLSESVVERLADKIAVEGDLAVTPKDKLLKNYASLA